MGEKKTVKSDQFFCGHQYSYPTNNLPRLKLTLTKDFYPSFFLENSKTKIFIKISD